MWSHMCRPPLIPVRRMIQTSADGLASDSHWADLGRTSRSQGITYSLTHSLSAIHDHPVSKTPPDPYNSLGEGGRPPPLRWCVPKGDDEDWWVFLFFVCETRSCGTCGHKFESHYNQVLCGVVFSRDCSHQGRSMLQFNLSRKPTQAFFSIGGPDVSILREI